MAAKRDDDELEPKTIAMMDLALRILEAEIGDLPVDGFETAHVHAYRRALASLPGDWAKAGRQAGATLKERLEAGKARAAAAPASGIKSLHPKTVSKTVGFVSSFFTWARDNRVPVTCPLKSGPPMR